MTPGQFLSPRQVKTQYLPHRGLKWIKTAIRRGDLGPDVAKDGRGWLVRESGVLAYLEAHRVCVLPAKDWLHKKPRTAS